jgi:hypothetical protein
MRGSVDASFGGLKNSSKSLSTASPMKVGIHSKYDKHSIVCSEVMLKFF